MGKGIVMITITISDMQLERLKRQVIAHHLTKKYDAALEEDCALVSPVEWHITPSGIGDAVVAELFGHKIDVSIGDDGQFVWPEEDCHWEAA